MITRCAFAAVLLALTISAPKPAPPTAPPPAVSRPGCYPLAHGDVDALPHGFYVAHLDAFFHAEDALPSGDDWFWLCIAPEGSLDIYVPVEAPLEDEDQEGMTDDEPR